MTRGFPAVAGEMIDDYDDTMDEFYDLNRVRGVRREKRRENKRKMRVDGAGLRDISRRIAEKGRE